MEKPETRNALLPSAGYGDRRPTKHVFIRYEQRTMRDPNGLPLEGVVLVYRCNETGATRTWGFE